MGLADESRVGFWDTFRENVELSQGGYSFWLILCYLWQYLTDHRLLEKKIYKEKDLRRRKETAQKPVTEQENGAYAEKYGRRAGYVVKPELKEAIEKRGIREAQKVAARIMDESDASTNSTCTLSRCDKYGFYEENAMGLLDRGRGSMFYLKNRRHGSVIVLRSTSYNDVVKAYDMAEWEIKEVNME